MPASTTRPRRDNEAIDLYNEIAAKPSATVSTTVAQLDLADLYASEGKQDQAHALWAKVRDADKDGAAGRSRRRSWLRSRDRDHGGRQLAIARIGQH